MNTLECCESIAHFSHSSTKDDEFMEKAEKVFSVCTRKLIYEKNNQVYLKVELALGDAMKQLNFDEV